MQKVTDRFTLYSCHVIHDFNQILKVRQSAERNACNVAFPICLIHANFPRGHFKYTSPETNWMRSKKKIRNDSYLQFNLISEGLKVIYKTTYNSSRYLQAREGLKKKMNVWKVSQGWSEYSHSCFEVLCTC